jgi:hypothetical protein
VDMTFLIDRDFQPFFARVAKANWWYYESQGNGHIEFKINQDRLKNALPQVQEDAKQLLKLSEGERSLVGSTSLHTTIIMQGKILATGPKLFKVNRETCEALAQVEPNIAVNDYQQPYEAMIVELDQEWVRSLGIPPNGLQMPRYALLWHHKPLGMVVCSLVRDSSCTGLTMIMVMGGRKNTIEEMLYVDGAQFGGRSEDGDAEYAYKLHRVALNYSLLAVHLGTKSTGWADPKWHAKHAKLKGERGELFRLGDIELMDLAQKIQLVRRERINDGGQDGDGTPHKPHWRRGHFRNQPCGPGRSQRKLVFIAPVFIHSELVLDQSSTSVVYQ